MHASDRVPISVRIALLICALVAGVFGGSSVPSAEAGPFAYVGNSADGTVSVIDTATNAVVATIPVGGTPLGVAVNAAGTRVYITEPTADTLVVIDATTNLVAATIPIGGDPFNVAVNPSGTTVYVTKSATNEVVVVDAASHTLVGSPIPVGSGPHGIVVNAADTHVYVVNESSGDVSVIDTSTLTVTNTIAVGAPARGIAISAAGTRAYVTVCGSTVVVIDTTGNSVVTSIPVGSCPDGIAINPDGTRVYAANNNAGTLSVIDTGANSVVATAGVGSQPHGVSVTPTGAHVYVANYASNTVSVVDASTNTVVATIPVGNGPHAFGIFISPGGGAGPTAQTVYLHRSGSTLFLDDTAPTAATAQTKDSTGVNFNGGNPWKEIGTWTASSAPSGTLTTLGDLHAWLGLKNSDDQGTAFDLRADVYENTTLVASGLTRCITGITRNPSLAKEVTVPFAAFVPTSFNGTTDVLSVKVLTRVGTNPDDTKCSGHNSATGLRLYFDSVTRPSQFDVTFE